RALSRWRDRNWVAGADLALDDDPGVHPRVRRVHEDRDPARLPVPERALDDIARVRRAAQLEHRPVPDRESRANGQLPQLDPDRGEVLPDRSRLDRVAVGLDALDRLDAEQRDRAMRPAV